LPSPWLSSPLRNSGSFEIDGCTVISISCLLPYLCTLNSGKSWSASSHQLTLRVPAFLLPSDVLNYNFNSLNTPVLNKLSTFQVARLTYNSLTYNFALVVSLIIHPGPVVRCRSIVCFSRWDC
jgi:hypothetical protein